MQLIDDIFSINSQADFQDTCLKVFRYQYENSIVYSSYCDHLNTDIDKITSIADIPFLPIEFFKSKQILADGCLAEKVFQSSGTGGIRSKHYVADFSIYSRSFLTAYKELIGNPKNQVILALLPNYKENGDSSLIAMVDELMLQTENEFSGYVLDDRDSISKRYEQAITQGKQVVLFGVSYALLDLAELGTSFPEMLVIETGGMKGNRKEITKNELHEALKNGLRCKEVYSEYGMTELLSQAYSKKNLEFQTPKWMKVLIREVNDPFNYAQNGKTGGINIIDLANIYSCSFIATQDLGKSNGETFQVLGRFDNSDIRGCNLLVE